MQSCAPLVAPRGNGGVVDVPHHSHSEPVGIRRYPLNCVRRPRLHRVLDEAFTHHSVVVLQAAAGAGKRTLAEQYRRGQELDVHIDVVDGSAFPVRTAPGGATRHLVLVAEILPRAVRDAISAGAVGIVQEQALDFTREETAQLVKITGAQLDPDEVQRATFGWAAGVGAAVLGAIPGGPESPEVSAALVETAALDEHARRFLVRMAVAEVLDRATVFALADPDDAVLLEEIRGRSIGGLCSTTNGLIVAPQLRRALLEMSFKEDPVATRDHLQRYADLCARQGDYRRAAMSYLELGDHDRACLHAENSLRLLSEEPQAAMAEWVGLLGEGLVRSRPLLVAGWIKYLHQRADFAAARRLIRDVCESGQLDAACDADPDLPGVLASCMRSDPVAARQLLAGTPRGDRFTAATYMFEVLTDDRPASPPPGAVGDWVDVDGMGPWALLVQGRLAALSSAELPDNAHIARTSQVLALRWCGEREKALEQWDSIPLAVRRSDFPHYALVAGLLHLADGDFAAARCEIERSMKLDRLAECGRIEIAEILYSMLMMSEQHHEDASALLERWTARLRSDRQFALAEWAQALLGCAYLQMGRDEDALELLSSTVRAMREARRGLLLPLAAVALSEAYTRAGDSAAAIEAADTALAVARDSQSNYWLCVALAWFPAVRHRAFRSRVEGLSWQRVTIGGVRPKPVHLPSIANIENFLEVHTFGRRPSLVLNGHDLTTGRTKVIELAALLGLHPGGIERGHLQEQLFPDQDTARSGNHLRQIIHQFRATTGFAVERRGDLVMASPDIHIATSDARFEALVELASCAVPPVRRQRLQEALDLVKGEYLEASGSAWVEMRRTELDILYEDSLHEMMQIELGEANYLRVRELGAQILGRNPYSESAFRILLSVERAVGTEASWTRIYRKAVESMGQLGLPFSAAPGAMRKASPVRGGRPRQNA